MTDAPLPGGDATTLDTLRCDQQFTQVCALPNGHNGPHKSIHTLRREEGYDATIDIQRNHLTLARQQVTDLEAGMEVAREDFQRALAERDAAEAQVTALQQEREDIHATRITWQVRAEAAEQQVTALRAAKDEK